MHIKDRILQSLRPRRDGILLRADVSRFGSATQVTAALNRLVKKGLLARVGRGMYAKPRVIEELGGTAVLLRAKARLQTRLLHARAADSRALRQITSTARFAQALAKRERVTFVPTYADQFAASATRLSDDVVKSDATDDLLVALRRAGKLTASELVMHVMAHHRSLKHV